MQFLNSIRGLSTTVRKKATCGPRSHLRHGLGCLAGFVLALPGSAAHALTVTTVTSDNGYPAHLIQWTDSAALPRSAVLVDQNSTGAGPYTGYLRRYTYQVNGQTRTCTGTDNPAAGGVLEFSGDGFVQNHTADGGDFSSGNGVGVPGTTTVNLQGGSHTIITFAMPAYTISGEVVPTTVQWFFTDGRDHPIFAVSQDARNTSGNLGADTRSPYGDMAYDGDGVGALVGGFSYGDTFKFYTAASNPETVISRSGWSDTRVNTIPYTMQWANPATVDAEMGHVATVPISVCDQGQDTQTSMYDNPPDLFDPRTQQKPGGPLPAYNTYAYQIINYSLQGNGQPTDSKRLAWGSNFGRVGGFDNYGDGSVNPKQYSRHSDDPVNQPLAGSRADGMLMAYSTFIVFGKHNGSYASGAVGNTVTNMEQSATATLTPGGVGTVVTSGPAGVGNATNVTVPYTPTGYNPIYAAWELNASQNSVAATLSAGANSMVVNPVFLIDGYTDSRTPTITLNGNTPANGQCYVSVDLAQQRLWVTLTGSFGTNLNFRVQAPMGMNTVHPAFFTGENALSQGVYYLQFPSSGQVFGYYEFYYTADSHFLYHFDLGFEYVLDAADGHSGVYLYDFTSNTFWYTSPTFPFPYLYDFSLHAFLYYYPDPTNPQRYNTNGVRYFYNFATGKVISK